MSFPEDLTRAFDRDSMRREIEDRFRQTKRLPGEPKLRVELSISHSMTPTPECPEHERQRRSRMLGVHAYVRILLGSKEVSKTTANPLDESFTITFNQRFPVQLRQSPAGITLQLWEAHETGRESLVSEVYLSVPEPATSRSASQIASLDFTSDRALRVDYADNGRVRQTCVVLYC